ncbi:hypothetical protein GCM10022270_13860 [Terriglobus aquaticus]
MPTALAADSYAIYSQLLPSSQIEWSDVPRDFWLLEGTTTALPLESSCATGGSMNPHVAIKAPDAQKANFDEVLADFDRRCHERYQLDAAQIHTRLPVHLLDQDAQRRYSAKVSGFMPPANNVMQAPPTPHEFKGAAGMHSFTAVYFNQAHTLAMTQFGMYCGGLCGNWTWVVLQRASTGWTVLPWVSMSMMS